MPIAMLEAGASKLPIISTKVGSIPNILDDTSAYLSDLDHFSENMVHVINNYPEAEHFYKQVKEKYTTEKMVEPWKSCIGRLVDSGLLMVRFHLCYNLQKGLIR